MILLLYLVIVYLFVWPLPRLITFAIADYQARTVARRLSLKFIQGTYGSVFQRASRSAIAQGKYHGRNISVRYIVSTGFKDSLNYRLEVTVVGNTHGRAILRIKPNTWLHSGLPSYSLDEWDKHLLVESHPRAFGKSVLASSELRSKIRNAFSNEGLFTDWSAGLTIGRTGNVRINTQASLLDTDRAFRNLNLAEQIANLK